MQKIVSIASALNFVPINNYYLNGNLHSHFFFTLLLQMSPVVLFNRYQQSHWHGHWLWSFRDQTITSDASTSDKMVFDCITFNQAIWWWCTMILIDINSNNKIAFNERVWWFFSAHPTVKRACECRRQFLRCRAELFITNIKSSSQSICCWWCDNQQNGLYSRLMRAHNRSWRWAACGLLAFSLAEAWCI